VSAGCKPLAPSITGFASNPTVLSTVTALETLSLSLLLSSFQFIYFKTEWRITETGQTLPHMAILLQ
jgi:hypothetical protein